MCSNLKIDNVSENQIRINVVTVIDFAWFTINQGGVFGFMSIWLFLTKASGFGHDLFPQFKRVGFNVQTSTLPTSE